MTKTEISSLILRGTATAVSIEHEHKTELQKHAIESIVRDAKRALLQKKNVHIVLVKE